MLQWPVGTEQIMSIAGLPGAVGRNLQFLYIGDVRYRSDLQRGIMRSDGAMLKLQGINTSARIGSKEVKSMKGIRAYYTRGSDRP